MPLQKTARHLPLIENRLSYMQHTRKNFHGMHWKSRRERTQNCLTRICSWCKVLRIQFTSKNNPINFVRCSDALQNSTWLLRMALINRDLTFTHTWILHQSHSHIPSQHHVMDGQARIPQQRMRTEEREVPILNYLWKHLLRQVVRIFPVNSKLLNVDPVARDFSNLHNC